MNNKLRVLVAGCGNMGASHARAYHKLDDFEIVGLVSRTAASREQLNEELGGGYALFSDFEAALAATKPEVVSINTYAETHVDYAIKSLQAGAHVFVEKPLATTVEEAQRVVDTARAMKRKVVVGYILRVHPAWAKFVEIAKGLGKPLVMRMNLNQQSHGRHWQTHKNLMNTMSPIVDCGVHYVDIMCMMTRSQPVKVNAIGARLTEEIAMGMYNYGQLQVTFADGSVGWYEAGWGPMMSEVAGFVKDVIGPKGCVNIVDAIKGDGSQDIDGHSKTGSLKVHYAATNEHGEYAKPDEIVDTSDEPDHDGLCELEQHYLLKAIREDLDLTHHLADAVNSLRIVLAADEAFRTGKTVLL